MLAVAAPATAEVPAGGSTEGAPPTGEATTPSPPPGPSAPPAPAGPPLPSEAPPVTVPPPPTVPSVATPVFVPPKEPGAPPTATFSLHPSVTVYEEYSDNFRLSSAKKQENYRSALAPGAALDINSAFTTGRIAYTLTGAYDTSNDLSLFHSLLGSIIWRATPQLTLTVSDALSRSDVPEQADQLTLRRQRVTFTANTLFAGSEYHIGRIVTTESYRLSTFSDQAGADTTSHVLAATIGTSFYQATSVTAGYTYLTSNTSSTPGGATITGHTVTATIARPLSARASAGVTGSYSIRTSSGPGAAALSSRAFSPGTFGSAAFGSGAFGDYNIWNVTAFNAYTSGPLLLNGSLGFSRLTTGSRSFDSVSTQSTLSYRFTQAVATVAFDSGFSETFAQGQNFGVIQTRGVTASLSYRLTPLLTSQVAGFYRQNEGTGVIGGQSGLRSDSWGSTLTMTLQVSTTVNFLLDYRHTEAINSSLAAFGQTSGSTGYAENRIRLSLNATF
jgi:hypothetical protein